MAKPSSVANGSVMPVVTTSRLITSSQVSVLPSPFRSLPASGTPLPSASISCNADKARPDPAFWNTTI